MGVVICIIWFVTGMHWAFALGYLIMAVVADFVAGAGQYKSKKLNSLGKQMALSILPELQGTASGINHDGSTNSLIGLIKRLRK